VDRDSRHLSEARFLLARVGSALQPSREEVDSMRSELSALRAHPSCDAVLAERIGGVLLVLDVVAMTGLRPGHPQTLAG
jgi:hypothetical protein